MKTRINIGRRKLKNFYPISTHESSDLDNRYRNGGAMKETLEPRTFDLVDEMRWALQDPAVLANAFEAMGIPYSPL